MLRHIHDFCGVKFQLTPFKLPTVTTTDETGEKEEQPLRMGATNKVLMKCVGVGFSNLAKVAL